MSASVRSPASGPSGVCEGRQQAGGQLVGGRASPAGSRASASAHARRSSAGRSRRLRVDRLEAPRAPTVPNSAPSAAARPSARAARGRSSAQRPRRARQRPAADAASLVVLLGRLGLAGHPGAAGPLRGRPRSARSRRSAATRVQRPRRSGAPSAGGRRRAGGGASRRCRSDALDADRVAERRGAANGSPCTSYAGSRLGRRRRVGRCRAAAAAPTRGVVRGGPPGDDLALGPGQRDVEQPEVLAGLLGLATGAHRSVRPGAYRPPTSSTQSPAAVARCSRAAQDRPSSVVRRAGPRRRAGRPPGTPGPCCGARSAPDRAASVSSRRVPSVACSPRRLGHPVAQPLDQRADAELAGDHGGVQALARCRRSVSRRSPPGRPAAARGSRVSVVAPPAGRRRPGRPAPGSTSGPAGSGRSARPRRRPRARRRSSRRSRSARPAGWALPRLLQGDQQGQPVLGQRRRRRPSSAPCITAGTPAADERVADRLAAGVGADQDGDVGRLAAGRGSAPSSDQCAVRGRAGA